MLNALLSAGVAAIGTAENPQPRSLAAVVDAHNEAWKVGPLVEKLALVALPQVAPADQTYVTAA